MQLNHKRLKILNEELIIKTKIENKTPNQNHDFSIILNIQQRQIDLLRYRLSDLEETVSKFTKCDR